MNPTLDAIQEAINSTAKTILQARARARRLLSVALLCLCAASRCV
jgi:vacuolar-type H+-ATPase subunit H